MKSSTFIKLALVAGIVFAINRPPSLLMAGASLADAEKELLSPNSRECMIGEVTLFAGNFAPRNWANCEGQLIAIAENQALFSILGTTYGGDGRTTFGLPDLRGRVPVGVGSGPGLASIRQGQKWGQEEVALNASNLPPHTHSVSSTLNVATPEKRPSMNADGNILASGSPKMATEAVYTDAPVSGAMRSDAISNTVSQTGGGTSFSVRNPSLGMRYIICMQGVYPSRN